MTKRKRAEANRKEFTESNVVSLRPHKSKQYVIWDKGTKGLAILVSPGGTKSYRCVYYHPGSSKAHSMPIGRVGVMTLQEASDRCREIQRTAGKGDDPKSLLPRADQFTEALERYIKHEQIGRRGNKSALKTQMVLERGTRQWRDRTLSSIRYTEIDALLQQMRDGDGKEVKGRPYLANRFFAHLKDFFGWCVRSKLLDISPMQEMEKPWNGAKPRDRVWFKGAAADQLIRVLWDVADELGGNQGRYLKVMMLTGKRKKHLAAMRWEDIKDDWFWDAPESDVKNKLLFKLLLSSLVQRVLHPRQDSGLVFGKFDTEWLLRQIRKRPGVPDDFIYHGLKHVAETGTASLKVPPHIRDLLYDHSTRRGSGAVYDHHDYLDDMREATEKWAAHVAGLVAPKGVARLR